MRYVARVFAAAVGIFAWMYGCSSSKPPAADPGDGIEGANGRGFVRTGPCSVEGEVVQCHVETGRVGSVVNCFSGTQTCTNGRWGPCGGLGGGGTVTSVDVSKIVDVSVPNADIKPLTVVASDASSTAAACASNPCNPFCVGIDVDAGALSTSTFVTLGVQGTLSNPSSFPAGVTGPKAQASQGVTGPPARFNCTPGNPPADYKDCHYDYCCATSGTEANTCQPWAIASGDNPTASSCVKPSAVDFTLGLGCTSATDSSLHVPICNRGQTATPTTGSLLLNFYPGNPNSAGTINNCLPNGPVGTTCTVNLATNYIQPGTCIDVNLTAAAGTSPPTGITCSGVPSGNTTMFVNVPISRNIANSGGLSESGTTVTVTTTAAHGFAVGRKVVIAGATNAAYNGVWTVASIVSTTQFTFVHTASALAASGGGTASSPAIAEGDACNNYSFLPSATDGVCAAYGVQPPPPANSGYVYIARCGPGERVQWNQFAYDTENGGVSTILFRARTATLLGDGGTGTFSSPVTVANVKSDGTGDPAPDCFINGTPAGCPKSLATALGADAYKEVLELLIDITASAPPAPVVNSWQVSYSCQPVE
jgi:hypothetical protein